MSSAARVVPGWHGKLPALGDFASRRLEPEFLEPWDDWLARSLLALRESDPPGWLAAYLASPSWRFLLCPGAMPGTAGRQGWAGVLMPSVDRVGRYFPLTIVRPVGEGPADTQQMTALWHWLARLDELAADALHDDWTIERLEDELARMAEPELGAPDQASCASPAAPAGTGRTEATLAPAPAQRLLAVTLPPGGDAARHIGAEAQALWRAQAQGRAYWHASTDLGGTRLMLSCGLPTPAQSAGLLAATL